MDKYMLILFEDQSMYETFSPEEMQKEIEVHQRWIEELGDHFAGGEPLEHEARSVKGSAKVTMDGPYIESKELVSGYYFLMAESLEQATDLAKGCPVLRLGGSVEVRKIMEM